MVEGTDLTGDEWTLASFTAAIHRGGVGMWAWAPEARLARLDGLCMAFWGTTEPVVSIDALFAKVNAEDRPKMMLDWFASATSPKAYSFDFRIGEDPDVRWISARGIGGDEGRVGAWIQAIFLDITDRKRAEEAERLMTLELAHRVSNMFTVARALTNIVAREAESTASFAEDLSRRFHVLHEATTLATRSHGLEQGDVRLRDLAARILSPYLQGANIAVDIEDAAVAAPDRVDDYAMIFHELATNSAKYGALAIGGTLNLVGRVVDHALTLDWTEGAAPSGTAKADGTGFGSRLLTQTIERSLAGQFQRTIDDAGLHFRMIVPIR
ncbi:HWE histidine kinase domain-containing protein [Methylobacterium sp. 092160098-2]|uniref:HWE histidine kinase domain-containing protein n=1 Tax=Methylobacterium sp. 092160098-2 TaxID=3025129 RepID=UPI002381BFBF|nr:HWE histidine kinase domain-containing protein [Methylobacterium sp. 092160098-2]MDE4909333.1 HWE histidine kinase domain-containing protein [Methylobacterium sp. 092160098-2]